MQFVGVFVILGAFAVFGTLQARYIDAYLERYGGPGRQERHRIFAERPLDYFHLVRHGPPFGLRGMLRPVPDEAVERKRREMLASLALIPLGVSFSVWVTLSARGETSAIIIAVGGVATSLVWGLVLLVHVDSRWLRVAAWVGVVAGIAVTVAALAFRGT